MKESYWGYWLLVLGVFVVTVLLLVQSFTSTNTQDYYMVKSITEAAMEDAIDYGYYRTYGEAKINKEKFEESFLRRFAEQASIATTYEISFSDIYEAPPKVSVNVTSKAGGFNISGENSDIDIVNKIDAILESSEYTTKLDKQGSIQFPVKGDDASYTKWLTDDEAGNVYKNKYKSCNIEFKGTNCSGVQASKPIKCGYPSSEGINHALDKGHIYCLLQSTVQDVCVAYASIDMMEYIGCTK